MSTIDKIMDLISDIITDADVEYPAGRAAGLCITYDDDAIRKAMEEAFAQYEKNGFEFYVGDNVRKNWGARNKGVVLAQFAPPEGGNYYVVHFDGEDGAFSDIASEATLEVC